MYGLKECKACPWPSYSVFEGQNSCSGFYINTASHVWGSLLGFLCFLFMMGVWQVDGKFRIAVFLIIAFPAMDIISDLIYLLTNPFINRVLFGLMVGSFFVSAFVFIYKLYEVNAVPFTVQYYPGYCFVNSLFWLSNEVGTSYPTIEGRRTAFLFDKYDDLGKVFSLFMLWLGLIILQVLFVAGFFVWMLVTSPPMIVLYFIGFICFQTKVLAVKQVCRTVL
jgi:hypothetical protein